MKRIIEDLNEMSFDLPDGWKVSNDKYNLMNGQGFINCENYITSDNEVVSLFEIQREPDEFFESFHNLTINFNIKQDGLALAKQFSINVNGFSFPVYILHANRENKYIVQIFINCGDCLGCLIFNINHFEEDKKALMNKNPLFKQVAQLLRTVE